MDEIKLNITHNILETHLTLLSKYFSICPPLAAITLSSLPLKLFTACCMERFFRDFGPFSLKGLFQSFRTIVSSSAGFPLQDGPHTEVQRVQVCRWRGPQFLLPKRRKVTHTPILRFVCRVRGSTVLVKDEWSILKAFLYLGMSRSQNINDVRVCVDFSAFFSEGERRVPTLRDGSQTITEQAFGDGKHILRMWGYYPYSLPKFSLPTVNIFSSEKMILLACVPSFIAFKRIFDLSNLFCFCNAVSYWLRVVFKGDNLRPSSAMVLTFFSSISKLLVIFLMLRLRFLSIRSIMTISNCVRAVRKHPHQGRSLHVPSSL